MLVGVARRLRFGVGLDGYELASVVDVPVPPQHLVVRDAAVVGVVPGQVNAGRGPPRRTVPWVGPVRSRPGPGPEMFAGEVQGQQPAAQDDEGQEQQQ